MLQFLVSNIHVFRTFGVAVGILLLFAVSDSRAQQFPNLPGDRNGDGRLSRGEFRGPPSAFRKLDSDGDGYLSARELRSGRGGERRSSQPARKEPEPRQITAPKPSDLANTPEYVDVHDHLTFGRGTKDFRRAAEIAIREMDRVGVRTMLVMPPPQTVKQAGTYRAEKLVDAARAHPGRLYFLGGGGSLNVMLQEAVAAGSVSADLGRRFEARARALADMGAVGFGEMTAEHFSLNPHHPYVTVAPDHPLFLLLADLSAELSLPIDFHMEAVRERFVFSRRYRSNPSTPAAAAPNLAAFERLLAHDSQARIVWSHAGWDNTGHRTPAITRELLARHPNLYISLRVPPRQRHEPSLQDSRLADESGVLTPAWRALIEAFSDRVMIGGDEFFPSSAGAKPHPSKGSVAGTMVLLDQLSEDTRWKVGSGNARRVFGLVGG